MLRMSQSLRGKILAGYLVLVLITAMVGIWSIYNFIHLNGVLTEITRENYISVLAAENMIGALERQDSAELMLLLGELRGGSDIFQFGEEEFQIWLDKEENNITLPGEGDVVVKVRDQYGEYIRVYNSLHDLAVSGRQDEARRQYLIHAEPLFKSIRGQLRDLLEMNHQALMDGNAQSRRAAWRATVSTVGVGGLAVLLALAFGLGISGAVVRPTVRLTGAIREIRAGNLDETVEVGSKDEIGELATEFNRMVTRLRAYEEAMNDKVLEEQQKALTILTAIDDGVILTDDRHRVIMINPAAELILKTSGEEALGRDIAVVTRQPIVQTMVDKVLSTGQAPHNRTIFMEVEGEQRFYDVEVVPQNLRRVAGRQSWDNSDAAIFGTVVLLKDVSYFKRLEKMKTEFLSDISHEIRTPLTTIAMGVGMLKESRLLATLDREKELLETVEDETARLTTLVGQLLELSRLELGRIRLKMAEVSPTTFLEHSIAPFRPQAAAQNILLTLSVSQSLPKLRMDPDRMQSVVANLVTNALRYTPERGRIEVAAGISGEELVVSVSDTGPGIPEDARERIFDRFFQIGGRPAGQAGLGLSISKLIIEAHGGRIWVEERPEWGSTFVFSLPLRSAPPMPENEA